MARPSSRAAYFLVDPSDLPDDVRKEVIEDANNGGVNFGVRIVEESVNGSARAALYGVYYDVPDPNDSGRLLNDSETRWNKAKEELGIRSTEVDDSEVLPDGATSDPRREAALRLAAEERARADADRIRAVDDAAVDEVLGDRGTGTHASNIVDDGLAQDATNTVEGDGSVSEQSKPKAKTNKAPR